MPPAGHVFRLQGPQLRHRRLRAPPHCAVERTVPPDNAQPGPRDGLRRGAQPVGERRQTPLQVGTLQSGEGVEEVQEVSESP